MNFNNGLKSGLLIMFISVLGIVGFLVSGNPIPVFFKRFLVVGFIITFIGLATNSSKGGKL